MAVLEQVPALVGGYWLELFRRKLGLAAAEDDDAELVNALARAMHAGGADFTLTEVELEGPRDDEVLVRIVAAGLCHTDLTMRTMLPAEMFPNVFGHEGAGVVEAVGAAVTGIEVGDHVALSFRHCGACAKCQEGIVGYCESSLLLNYMGQGAMVLSVPPEQASELIKDPFFLMIPDVVRVPVVILSLLATLYPSWRASRVNPAEALRYE